MGWASGSELMEPIIEALMKAVPNIYLRRRFYTKVIPVFQDQGWDTESELIGTDPAFDQALKKIFQKQGIEFPDGDE